GSTIGGMSVRRARPGGDRGPLAEIARRDLLSVAAGGPGSGSVSAGRGTGGAGCASDRLAVCRVVEGRCPASQVPGNFPGTKPVQPPSGPALDGSAGGDGLRRRRLACTAHEHPLRPRFLAELVDGAPDGRGRGRRTGGARVAPGYTVGIQPAGAAAPGDVAP